MSRAVRLLTSLALALGLLRFGPARAGETAPAAAERCVLRAKVDGIVTSATADSLVDAIRVASEQCSAALLVLDTPGGELEATRAIVSAILGAGVPVLTYVAPSGARAGSAGVFIEMSGHVAAMAPGTNIGAAHPVFGLGGGEKAGSEMARKVENDVAAFARAIAQQRGRNARWAERAVRESVSATAAEALDLDVVDLIAPAERDLLSAVDGRAVRLASGRAVVLRTRGAEIRSYKMSPSDKARAILATPDLAFLLLMVGILGLIIELTQPGLIIPGAAGLLCLLLAAVGLNLLPVRIGAIALLAAGAALLVAELYVASFGFLALAGLAGLAAGALLLWNRDSTDFFADASVSVSLATIIPLALVFAGTAAALAWFGARARKRRSPTGAEGLIGRRAETLTAVDSRGGRVRIDGERWRAVSGEPIPAGRSVTVTAVRGLEVVVSSEAQEGES